MFVSIYHLFVPANRLETFLRLSQPAPTRPSVLVFYISNTSFSEEDLLRQAESLGPAESAAARRFSLGRVFEFLQPPLHVEAAKMQLSTAVFCQIHANTICIRKFQ